MALPLPGRVLAVDFGGRRIGLAISDPTRCLATPAGMVEARTPEDAIAIVAREAVDREALEIVVGIPFNMDGSLGESGTKASQFADRLAERTGLPVRRWDERLTTTQARRALHGAGVRQRRGEGRVDAMAAQFILQSYLDASACRARDAEASPAPEE